MATRLSTIEIETIKKLRDQGHKLSYIAYKTKRDEKTIRRYLAKKYKSWTAEDIEKAFELKGSGLNYKQIGEALGRTKISITQLFFRYKHSVDI
jgi:hypothetical protein